LTIGTTFVSVIEVEEVKLGRKEKMGSNGEEFG